MSSSNQKWKFGREGTKTDAEYQREYHSEATDVGGERK